VKAGKHNKDLIYLQNIVPTSTHAEQKQKLARRLWYVGTDVLMRSDSRCTFVFPTIIGFCSFINAIGIIENHAEKKTLFLVGVAFPPPPPTTTMITTTTNLY
jgi:hypothetical protein